MRSILGLLGMGVLAALAGTSNGAIITLSDTTGDPASVTVDQGASFDMRAVLTLDAGEDAAGTSFLLNSSQSNIFTITDLSLDAANPFTSLAPTQADVLDNSPGLNPSNGRNLGGLAPGNTNRSAGTYPLYTFTLAVAATAPLGTYQITVVEGYYTTAPDYTNNDVIASTTYNVTVVPEPVSIGMVGAFVGSLVLRRRPAVA